MFVLLVGATLGILTGIIFYLIDESMPEPVVLHYTKRVMPPAHARTFTGQNVVYGHASVADPVSVDLLHEFAQAEIMDRGAFSGCPECSCENDVTGGSFRLSDRGEVRGSEGFSITPCVLGCSLFSTAILLEPGRPGHVDSSAKFSYAQSPASVPASF